MSRVLQFFVANHLQRMGWPREKGIFRKIRYVPTQLVDVAMEQGLQICMGLGAGKPELACKVITDTYGDNPWTEASVNKLLANALDFCLEHLNKSPGIAPWKALYAPHTMSSYGKEVEWAQLGNKAISVLWMGLGSYAAIWGLGHQEEFLMAFNQDRDSYDTDAPNRIKAGLDISTTFPWASSQEFYESCADIVADFEAERGQLGAIPMPLRRTALVVGRLGLTQQPRS